jgi:molybdenum cofactor cytidylyltransferase
MSVAAIVLAAGSSSRMGRSKQLLQIDGQPLVRRAVRIALAAGVDEVVVVIRPGYAAIAAAVKGPRVRVVENPNAAEGMGTSIVCGVEAIDPDAAVMVVLCDQARVTTAHLRALLDMHRVHPDAIVATHYAGIGGVPAIFPAWCRPELRALTGDRGARGIIEANRDALITIIFEDAAIDIDTMAQYRRLKK